MKIIDSGHEHVHREGGHSKKALIIAICATSFILAVEVVGGIWTNSLSLLSDAAHVLMDLFSFILTLSAMILAARPVSQTRTYGLHRLEVFAALVNGMTVIGIAVAIVYFAVQRFQNPEAIRVAEMLGIAVLGLIVNLWVVLTLHPHSHKDINVRSALWHSLGDAAASVAVIGGGLLTLLTGSKWADPVAALAVALIILAGAYKIFSDSVHILLEGAPRGMRSEQIAAAVESIAGSGAVRDLHVWNLCSHICMLSLHIRINESQMARQREILDGVTQTLKAQFDIDHPTIQIESENWK